MFLQNQLSLLLPALTELPLTVLICLQDAGFASDVSLSDAFVKSAGMKFPELQQAVTPQHAVTDAVNTSVTDCVTDAELSAFTQGLDSLAESHMASTHSRSTRPSVGTRSQVHHVADMPEHEKKKTLSDLPVDSLLASAVVSHLHAAHFLFCFCQP